MTSHVFSVGRSSDSYLIRGTNISFSGTSLRKAQYTLAVFVSLGALSAITLGVINKNNKDAVPAWAYPVDIGFTAIAVVVLIGSRFLIQKVGSEKTPLLQCQFPKGHRLDSVSDLSSDWLVLLDELCERDKDGEEMTCSLEKMSAIIEQLKEAKMLFLLNTIPNYFLNNYESSADGRILMEPSFSTPLHYWAKRGNLQAVKMLLENGANDHFTEGDNFHRITSGVYLAALYGHPEVVEYLLKNGSHTDVAFSNNNVLRCFIPKLVFEITQFIMIRKKEEDVDNALKCLRIVLNHLKKQNLKNLNFQFKIPLKKDLNCLNWIEWKYSTSAEGSQEFQRAKRLKELLIEFGADKQKVYSIEELKTLSYNVGNCFTLHSATTLK